MEKNKDFFTDVANWLDEDIQQEIREHENREIEIPEELNQKFLEMARTFDTARKKKKKKEKYRRVERMGACVLVFVISAGTITMGTSDVFRKKVFDVFSKKEITFGDHIQYDYEALKENAKVIAKIEAVDELGENNSHIIYDSDAGDNSIIGYYSARKVRIIDVYKSAFDFKEGDVLDIIESSAICDGLYLHDKNYEPMKKDTYYYVFLNDDTASGQLSIMSCSNGLLDLENIEKSEYVDVAVKTVIEFESDLALREKRVILNAEKIKKAETKNEEKLLNKTEKVTIKDEHSKKISSYEISYGNDGSENLVVDIQSLN